MKQLTINELDLQLFNLNQLKQLVNGSTTREQLCAKMTNTKIGNILVEFPQHSNLFNLDKLSGQTWIRLLHNHVQFADKCDWSKLDGIDWTDLLVQLPQFADKCKWSKLNGLNWAHLLIQQPQFADKCDWSKFGDFDWRYLLRFQPQLVQYKPK